jgi:ankyrin repeat protein
LEEIAALLLSEGAVVNCVDKDKQTPVMLAAVCDHPNLVRLLIQHGADLSLKNAFDEMVSDLPDLSPAVMEILQENR